MDTDEKPARAPQNEISVFIRVHPWLKNSSTPRDQVSRMVSVVLLHRLDNPLLRLKDSPHGVRLSFAEFQHDPPAWLEKRPGFRRQQTMKIQPVQRAVQRAVRIEIAHF